MAMRQLDWTLKIIRASLRYRLGRTIALLLLLVLAATLAGAFLCLSVSLDRLLARQLERYGANVVMTPGESGGERPILMDEAIAGRLQELHQGRPLTTWQRLRVELAVNDRPVKAEGIEPAELARYAGWWRLAGEWPRQDELLMGSALAGELGIAPGAELVVAGRTGSRKLRLSGVISSGEEDDLLIVPLTLAQQLTGLEGKLSQLRLLLSTDRPLAESVARLQREFPTVTVREVRQVARAGAQLREKVLLLFSVAAVVTGLSAVIGVAGTLGAGILEREQEIGLMKSLGATRGRLSLLFAGEALLLGLVAGVAGGLLGEAVSALVTIVMFSGAFEPTLLALPAGLLTGLMVTLAGSCGPLYRIHRLTSAGNLRR